MQYNGVNSTGIAKLASNLTLNNTGFTTSGPLPNFNTSAQLSPTYVPHEMKVIKNIGNNINKILLVGGFFGFNGSTMQGRGIARLMPNGAIDPTFNQGAIIGNIRGVSGSNQEIRTIYVYPDNALNGNAGKMLIGGMFSSYNGVAREKIARLNVDGSLDMTFNPNGVVYQPQLGNIAGFNSAVQAIAVQSDGRIIVGGYFNAVNGYSKKNIVRLNDNGSLDTTNFNTYLGPNPNLIGTQIRQIIIQPDDKIIIGGFFSFYNNVPRSSIARLKPNGALDEDFNPGAGFFPVHVAGVSNSAENGLVRSLVLDVDTVTGIQRLYVSGDFTKFNGTNCDEVIRLNCASTGITGSKDGSFGLAGGGPNDFVWSMKKQGTKLLLAGKFTTYAGLSAMRITRILPAGSSSESRSGTIFYESEPEIDLFSSDTIIVYPNPSTGIINFSKESFDENLKVEVFTSLGQKVFEKDFNNLDDATLDLSHLSKGNYFVNFSNISRNITKNVILK